MYVDSCIDLSILFIYLFIRLPAVGSSAPQGLGSARVEFLGPKGVSQLVLVT